MNCRGCNLIPRAGKPRMRLWQKSSWQHLSVHVFISTKHVCCTGYKCKPTVRFTLRSDTSGTAPVRSRWCAGVVSPQWDLKTESLHISPIYSHLDQHVHGNQSHVPNGFNLAVQLRLHQEQNHFRSIQFDEVCRSCLKQFSVVRFVFTLREKLSRTVSIQSTSVNRLLPTWLLGFMWYTLWLVVKQLTLDQEIFKCDQSESCIGYLNRKCMSFDLGSEVTIFIESHAL